MEKTKRILRYHVSVRDEGQDGKLLTTVLVEAPSVEGALYAAYLKICGWQKKEPEPPTPPQEEEEKISPPSTRTPEGVRQEPETKKRGRRKNIAE